MSFARVPDSPKHQFMDDRLPSPPVAKLESLSDEHRLKMYFQAFQKQDPHHSGRISVWGLKNALSELGVKPTAVALFNIVDVRKEAESLFSFCDFSEFITIVGDIEADEEEHKKDVKRAFNMIVDTIGENGGDQVKLNLSARRESKPRSDKKDEEETKKGDESDKKEKTGSAPVRFEIPHPSTYKFHALQEKKTDFDSMEPSHRFLDVDKLREAIAAVGLSFEADAQLSEFGNPDSLAYDEFYAIVSKEAKLPKAREHSRNEAEATESVREHLIQSASGSASIPNDSHKEEEPSVHDDASIEHQEPEADDDVQSTALE